MASGTLKALLYIILLVCFCSVAAGWGVVPARELVPYDEGVRELELSLENNDLQEGYFDVSFTGTLAPHASYDGGLVHVVPSEDSVPIPFSLEIPADMDPGRNSLRVKLQQVSSEESEKTVSSLISLSSEFVVFAPREGQHVNADVIVGKTSSEEPVPFTVTLLNTGSEAVPVWADVSVKTPLNAEAARLRSSETVLSPDEAGKVVASWRGERQPGAYYAEVVVHYGDKVKVLHEKFVVGSSELSIVEIGSPRFSLGDIVPLEVSVSNHWNRPSEDVYAEVFVLSDGRIVQSFKTPSEDVGPYGGATLKGFWDTGSLVVGGYDLQVKVHSDRGSSQRSYPVVVRMDRLDVDSSLSGEVVAGDASSGSGDGLLIMLILVVVVTNIVLLARLRRWKR